MLPFLPCFQVCLVVSILYYFIGNISYKLLNEGIFGTDGADDKKKEDGKKKESLWMKV
jgi:hypothetical protein